MIILFWLQHIQPKEKWSIKHWSSRLATSELTNTFQQHITCCIDFILNFLN
uniref:Uncharacterized protein n=1 Tax=Rhizophora mucronata TaxID=61149 RepID=A0A2P2P9S8_RHIMU